MESNADLQGKSRTPKRDLPEAEVAHALLCPSDKSSLRLGVRLKQGISRRCREKASKVKSEMDDE